MKTLLTLTLSLSILCQLFSAGSNLAGVASDDPQELARLVIDDLLERDYMHYGEKGLHYAEVCTALGALRFADKTNDSDRVAKLIERYDVMLEEGNDLVSRHSHVDQNVMGVIPLQIYLVTNDERYLDFGLSFADHQWEETTEDGLTSQTRWWIDDMYMVGTLQIQAYRATGEFKYADRAAMQLAAYLEKLQQSNGLFYHGPEIHYHWGRGNGWVASSLAEVLDSLPDDHRLKPQLIDGYKQMMKSLLDYQSDNGMWRQVVDYEYSWAETSCTAMFAFTMSVGVKHGWLDEATYGSAVDKALKALCAHVTREGKLREICVGTGQEDDIEFYLNRPRTLGDHHGQAPFLWLVNEMTN